MMLGAINNTSFFSLLKGNNLMYKLFLKQKRVEKHFFCSSFK